MHLGQHQAAPRMDPKWSQNEHPVTGSPVGILDTENFNLSVLKGTDPKIHYLT